MSTVHAVAWLDHNTAHIIHFDRDEVETHHLQAQGARANRQLHNKRSAHERHAVPEAFFDDIVAELEGAHEILVCGPGTAKNEFAKHVEKKHPILQRRIFDVQPMDHPSDGELLKLARAYFKAADRMR